MLDHLTNLMDKICTNIEMFYELVCDAEYGEATGLARGTLQNIAAPPGGARPDLTAVARPGRNRPRSARVAEASAC